MLKMETSKGWIAIIYDAPWARFKDGQPGVIVSDDGKTCETVDDDKSNIVVVADVNENFAPRKNGHILFKQKGTDLYDVVCLYQDATEHVYQLCISDDVKLDMTSANYGKLKDNLMVYWIIDGDDENRIECTNYDIITPTPQDSFNVETSYTISVSAFMGDRYYTTDGECQKMCIITGEEVLVYKNTEFNIPEGCPTIQKDSDGSNMLILEQSKSTLDCDGGDVVFSTKTVPTSLPTYTIKVSCASAIIHYDVMQNGVKIGETTDTGIIRIATVLDNNKKFGSGNVQIISNTGNEVKISVRKGMPYVYVVLQETKTNHMEQIQVNIP
jgi:hypothetical protein